MPAEPPVSPEATTQITPAAPAERVRPAPAGVLPDIDGFRVECLLGRGGMGSVYRAEEIALGRTVAIKVIAGGSENATNRFAREARLLATVEHPHVVRIYSFGSTEQAAYIAMEFIDGETLAQRIAQRGALPINEAIHITKQVVSALSAAAARQIVHRDVKPSNILLDRHGNAHVADFGLAKPVSSGVEPITHAGTVVGTPHYLSPEQAEGGEVGLSSDIYSLGVVMFEMLTGMRPFEASTPVAVIAKHLHEPCPSVAKLRRGVPHELSGLVGRMTRKSPAERPRSYDEIECELDAAAASRNKRISLQSVFAVLGMLTFLYVAFALSKGLWFGALDDAPPQEAQPRVTTAGAAAVKPRTFDGEPISVQLKDADLADVLRSFGALTGLNFAPDPDVRAQKISVDFFDVPWDAALETILKQNGLTYSVEGNIVRVGRMARFVEEAEQLARLGLPPSNVGGRFPAPKPVTPPQSALPPPSLLAPAANMKAGLNAAVEFRWSPQVSAVAYQLQVSRSRLFPGLEINEKHETTNAKARMTNRGTFYWRVASIDASGRLGPFSDYSMFAVSQ